MAHINEQQPEEKNTEKTSDASYNQMFFIKVWNLWVEEKINQRVEIGHKYHDCKING